MTIEWDIHGWKRLTANDNMPLVAAREEYLTWLAEVPEPHRIDLEHRLKSELDHAHLSACLELFVHRYFVTNGWEMHIHPPLSGSEHHPDFLAERGGTRFIVECKTFLDQPSVGQQEQLLRQLATELSRKLNVAVILEPLADLPPSLPPASRIQKEIEQQLQERLSAEVSEIDIHGSHQGAPYALRAIVIVAGDEEDLPGGVQGLMSQARTVTNSAQLRDAVRQKAGKYGNLEMPFVIAVSAETTFPLTSREEVNALFGDEDWKLHDNGQWTTSRKPNGLLAATRNGNCRYARVSAVLVHRFKWLHGGGHRHHMHIYHNPCATKPIDPGLFPRVHQFARVDESTMRWINEEPEP